MTHPMTLRLPDEMYETVKRYARTEHLSMNTWIEKLVEQEDMRRRCAAHDQWMRGNPQVAAAALEFHRANQHVLAEAGLPHMATEA